MASLMPFNYVLLIAMMLQANKGVDYKKVDEYLSNNLNVKVAYFDSLLEKDNTSSFLIGMKIYFNLDEIGYELADQLIQRQTKLQKADDPFGAYLELARAAVLRGRSRHGDALRVLQSSLKQEKLNKWSMLELYFLQLDMKSPDAPQTLDQLLVEYPSFGRAVVERAFTIDVLSNPTEVRSLLESVPKGLWDYSTHCLMGDALYFSGEFHDGLNEYERSIKLKENAQAFFGRGSYNLYTLGDLVGAERDFLNSIRVEPDHQTSLMGLAWVEYERENYAKGEAFFAKAHAVNKNVDCHEDYILFELHLLNYSKANALIDEYEELYGVNYKSEGYRMVQKIVADEDLNDEVTLKNYIDRFGDFSIEWLNDVIRELNEP
jgi:tetratricopeptide (TPR) repeat protein